ncbi:MAG: PilT/PilU family type 4a pilus ATPase [Verrucomicrobiae bacterium]|nr:PilT/PilU family type 4a pilus ATPase [Verrucomicrobiae bacterium]
MEQVPPDKPLGRLIAWSRQRGATDLHGRAGHPWIVRVEGHLESVPHDVAPEPDDVSLHSWLIDAFSPALVARIVQEREVDASFQFADVRYRANFSKQRGRQSLSFRVVPQQRMRLEDWQLPESLRGIADLPRGLLLLTGPTGQGKSTTARALIQELNETRALRIVTIEDPIEYVFNDALSHFEQREVGIDTASFADGIRNAMRQDPDVLFIGELRDRDSIWAGMQAAETGHLVLSTLHADSVPQAIGRIREFYPADEQSAVSALLARNLAAVVNQRLLPNVSGGRTPCVEILRRDAGVEAAIAQHELHLLHGIIEASLHVGMHTFDQYLIELLAQGLITEHTARRYAVHPHALDMRLRGILNPQAILRPDPGR